jgi:hypothetical protein
MDFDHLLAATFAGVPIAMWLFTIVATIVAVAATWLAMARPGGRRQGS